MQQNSNKEPAFAWNEVQFLVGNRETITRMEHVAVKKPFDDEIITFLNDFSSRIMKDREAKQYPDIVTLGFWIRKSSLLSLKKRFAKEDGNIRLGRGVIFHIAPSNVAVNYMYSLVSGLLMGNANIVRASLKEFAQVDRLNGLLIESLEAYPQMKPYIAIVRYERKQAINDYFSAMADVRVVWGGDQTIAELRKSPLKPRAMEVTFADRYSLAVIDSDELLAMTNLSDIANQFYNDTYLTDQNACTSPKVMIWKGSQKEHAKEVFWQAVWKTVHEKYTFQSIMGVNKLTSSYQAAVTFEGAQIIEMPDNLVTRVQLTALPADIMELREHSGFFFEYDCDDVMELRELCNDERIQTITMLGDKAWLMPLLASGIKGIDRIVPIGASMDFDLLWDGYDLSERFTRRVYVNE